MRIVELSNLDDHVRWVVIPETFSERVLLGMLGKIATDGTRYVSNLCSPYGEALLVPRYTHYRTE